MPNSLENFHRQLVKFMHMNKKSHSRDASIHNAKTVLILLGVCFFDIDSTFVIWLYDGNVDSLNKKNSSDFAFFNA